MDETWKTVQVYVPCDFSPCEVRRQINWAVRIVAWDAGEFVHDVKIAEGIREVNGWCKWRVEYLPGPPGIFWEDPDVR